MLGQGRDPAACTVDDARAAVQQLQAAQAQGQFAGAGVPLGREYTTGLVDGTHLDRRRLVG